jgi:flagellar hook-associated protein 2
MSGLNLSGLASGVDTSGIIDKLMAIERQKLTSIGYGKTRVQAEQTGIKAIAAKLSALKDAALALKSDGAVWKQAQTVESSDPTKVAVTKISGAGIGGHTIQVDRLASSAQHGFSYTAGTAGQLTLYYGTDPAAAGAGKVTIDVAADATAAQIADSINANGKAPVFAAVVKDQATGQDRLVLSARKSGQSGDFTVDTTAMGAGAVSADAAYARTGPTLDAAYRLDGAATAVTSESNVIENAVPGLRLTLKGVTTTAATITTGAPQIDTQAAKDKVKAFVDAYNAVVDTTRSKLDEKRVVNPASSSDVAKGQLFGDTALSGMLSKLRSDMQDTVAGLTGVDELGDLGIGVPKTSGGATTANAKAGKFEIDDAKLGDMIAADWTKVGAFFDGFSAKIETFVKAQTGTTDAILDGRVKNGDKRIKDVDGQLTRANDRIDMQEKRLKAQFAAMESALQSSQTQQTWLTGQLNALNR